MISRMRKGSVIVDVAIDQGGCVEGAVPTTHQDPVITMDGVTLFCVANMPGCVARTSTFALTNATFPYASKLANMGYKAALKADPALAKGLNVLQGKLVCKAVADRRWHGLVRQHSGYSKPGGSRGPCFAALKQPKG